MPAEPTQFYYSPWRHGGWYIDNVRYPSNACGCVSRNYEDGKWRIVCDPRPFDQRPTFKSRDEAARAEWHLAQAETAERSRIAVLAALERLLACPDLNLDELEPETVAAIEQGRAAVAGARDGAG